MEKLKELIKNLNEKGIPIPILRDPVKGIPSITFTFFFISGILWITALIGKLNGSLDINLTRCQEFFDNAAYIYLGRSLIKNIFNQTEEKKESKNETTP